MAGVSSQMVNNIFKDPFGKQVILQVRTGEAPRLNINDGGNQVSYPVFKLTYLYSTDTNIEGENVITATYLVGDTFKDIIIDVTSGEVRYGNEYEFKQADRPKGLLQYIKPDFRADCDDRTSMTQVVESLGYYEQIHLLMNYYLLTEDTTNKKAYEEATMNWSKEEVIHALEWLTSMGNLKG